MCLEEQWWSLWKKQNRHLLIDSGLPASTGFVNYASPVNHGEVLKSQPTLTWSADRDVGSGKRTRLCDDYLAQPGLHRSWVTGRAWFQGRVSIFRVNFDAVIISDDLFSSKTYRGRPSFLSCFLTHVRVAKWSNKMKEDIKKVWRDKTHPTLWKYGFLSWALPNSLLENKMLWYCFWKENLNRITSLVPGVSCKVVTWMHPFERKML